jgi:hypothetical protein
VSRPGADESAAGTVLADHAEALQTLLTMTAGYSGTPLARKLGVKAESRVLVLGQPSGTDLGVWECAVRHTRAGKGRYDVVLAFAPNLATLRRRLAPALAATTTPGRLWVCWPKRSSGLATDLTENIVRGRGLAGGIVDIKVCAIDDTWSGLAFVRRLRDR